MGVNISPNISPFIVYWFYRSMIPKLHDRMILTRETIMSNIYDFLKMPFVTSQIALAYFAVVITIAIDIQNKGCKLLLLFLQIAKMQWFLILS